MPIRRHANPDLIRYIWYGIKYITQQKLQPDVVQLLEHFPLTLNLTEETLTSYLEDAIKDKLIQYEDLVLKKGPRKGHKLRVYRIPDFDSELTNAEHDWYCYVCHIGGDVEDCSQCSRVFHVSCQPGPENAQENGKESGEEPANVENAISPDITQETNNSPLEEKNRIDLFTTPPPSTILPPPPNGFGIAATFQPKNLKNERESFESDTKMVQADVQFISVVRPPNKRYQEKQQRIKNEMIRNALSVGEEDPENVQPHENLATGSERSICSYCRMLKDAVKMQPPNMSKEELNYLLTFTFNRIRSWIPEKTYTPIGIAPRKMQFLTKAQLVLFKKFCLCFPLHITDIKIKLDQTEYETLNEFQSDLLDIQHSIGILHGVNSQEYKAMNYLTNDSTYEINEIRQCRDCYRHSNELSDNFWFTKPCVLRHELVFAKQIGFPYWPAKVIKVVDRKYDVRFFGGKHARAIIDANFVKPIDTSLAEIKITKKSSGFAKALEELEIHQQKIALPVGTFTFENEKRQKATSQDSVPPQPMINKGVAKRGRRSKNASNTIKRASKRRKVQPETQSAATNSIPTASLHTLPLPCISTSTESPAPHLPMPARRLNCPPILAQTDATQQQRPRIKGHLKEQRNANVVEALKKQLDQMTSPAEIKQLAIHTLETEIAWWQRRIKKISEDHQVAITEVKRKQWCSLCERNGKYFCCWNTNYCSIECQQKHWTEHRKNCTRNNGAKF